MYGTGEQGVDFQAGDIVDARYPLDASGTRRIRLRCKVRYVARHGRRLQIEPMPSMRWRPERGKGVCYVDANACILVTRP